jgi:hypothetical protein
MLHLQNLNNSDNMLLSIPFITGRDGKVRVARIVQDDAATDRVIGQAKAVRKAVNVHDFGRRIETNSSTTRHVNPPVPRVFQLFDHRLGGVPVVRGTTFRNNKVLFVHRATRCNRSNQNILVRSLVHLDGRNTWCRGRRIRGGGAADGTAAIIVLLETLFQFGNFGLIFGIGGEFSAISIGRHQPGRLRGKEAARIAQWRMTLVS